MNRVVFILLLIVMTTALAAQTGLLGLYYGEDFSQCRKNLESQDYLMIKNLSVQKQFALENPTDVYMVELYINPSTNLLIGWSLHYLDTISESQHEAILTECIRLHGDGYNIMEAENMIGWRLGDTKSLMLGYDDNDKLSVAVYYDDAYTEIFDSVK